MLQLSNRLCLHQSSNELKAIGVLILEYKHDRVSECCAAKEALDAKPEIAKNLEFDGPAPTCATSGGDEHIEVVEDGPEFIDPDWKEGEESEERKPQITGGWSGKQTADNNALSEEHMDMWDKVLEKYPTHEGHDLQKLGKPTSVQTQVVAGTNYKFGFKGDAVVRVFHQPWSDTLEITDVNIPSSQD